MCIYNILVSFFLTESSCKKELFTQFSELSNLSTTYRKWCKLNLTCPVGWSCKIHRLLLCRGVRPTQRVSWIWHKSDGEIPVILDLWGMHSTPSVPSLPGPLCLGEVAPDRFLSIGQIELNNVLMLSWIVWNWTVFWHWNYLLILN